MRLMHVSLAPQFSVWDLYRGLAQVGVGLQTAGEPC